MFDVTNPTPAEREAERAAGEPTRRGATHAAPSPELTERPQRRQFSAQYKLRIMREADACTEPGTVGALLRREGLYSSHLTAWRKQRDEGARSALSQRRGRRKAHPLETENAELRRRVTRAEADLAKARKVIEVQGNVSALLGELLEPRRATDNESSES
jgi:transposase